jgi:hypothetical protein
LPVAFFSRLLLLREQNCSRNNRGSGRDLSTALKEIGTFTSWRAGEALVRASGALTQQIQSDAPFDLFSRLTWIVAT